MLLSVLREATKVEGTRSRGGGGIVCDVKAMACELVSRRPIGDNERRDGPSVRIDQCRRTEQRLNALFLLNVMPSKGC